jgi:hypothetical protein
MVPFLRTDVLCESLLLLLRHHPLMMILCFFWIFEGRTHFKRRLSQQVLLDPACLPYREDLLAFLRLEKHKGREIFLATAADRPAVEPILKHVGLFAGCFASDGSVNLKGKKKGAVLSQRFGYRKFDYVGNDRTDLEVRKHANAAILVGSSQALSPR